MNPFFEITCDEIAQLNDSQLRELVGLLCEAEFRSHGMDTSAITWGGHQDAPDGGFDVVVKSKVPPPENSPIKRRHVGIQVKKSDMSPSKIRKEMCQAGKLRCGIKNLAIISGSYLIVSSGASTTATALSNRKAAMQDSVDGETNSAKLHIDFLDRGKVATWTRSHPALILWTKSRIGPSYAGWKPYDNWANLPSGVDDQYLLDDKERITDGTQHGDEGVSIIEGIIRLRAILSMPSKSVRLAGLSGVGKSRLVQALFDDRVGDNCLNRYVAFYTDVAESPVPSPIVLARQFIAQQFRAIIVLDNCPPILHRQMIEICTQASSNISLITVEYDVRDDLPPETSVFRLEPGSQKLIEQVIKSQYPHIGRVDAHTIAEFSGGNARIATALASTVGAGRTLSGLRDEEFFGRLFVQRQEPNSDLMASAEALALVYSFDGENTSEVSELCILSSIVGKQAEAIYRDIAELKSRDLIQTRSKWRAILPHAIANRLAANALSRIPIPKIIDAILECGSKRLVKSFSRRLSFLHSSQEAVAIANEWLTPNGWLGDVRNLGNFGIDVFENIAPVSPESALCAIERAAESDHSGGFASRKNIHFYRFVQILRSIAYEANLFRRCTSVLIKFALSEDIDEKTNSIRHVLSSLFSPYLSGTLAPPSERVTVIDELCSSSNPDHQQLGLSLLESALVAWHFSSAERFDFGARSRDFGYEPASRDDIADWYSLYIAKAEELAMSELSVARLARQCLAQKFGELWTRAGMGEELTVSARRLHAKMPWNEGWIAACETLYFDSRRSKKLTPKNRKQLETLERFLRPVDLIQKARAYVLSGRSWWSDIVESDENEDIDITKRLERAAIAIREIGIEIAQNEVALRDLLPEFITQNGPRAYEFGKGLALGSNNRFKLWSCLRSRYEDAANEKRNISVLLGYLAESEKLDPDFCTLVLDSLVSDEVLSERFPEFQIAATIDERGLKRLHQSLDFGIAPIWRFRNLAYGRALNGLDDDQSIALLLKISEASDGAEIALECLTMRFYNSEPNSQLRGDGFLAFGRNLLARFDFVERNLSADSLDYHLSEVAKVCMLGENAANAVALGCKNLLEAISEYRVYIFNYSNLLTTLARLQP